MESVPASATKTFQKDSTVQAYNKAGSVIQHFTIPAKLKHFGNRHRGRHPASPGRLHGHQPREHLQEGANGTGTPAADFTSPMTPGYSDSPQGLRQPEVQREAKARNCGRRPTPSVGSPMTSSPSPTTPMVDMKSSTPPWSTPSTTCWAPAWPPPTSYPTFNDFRTAVSDRKVNGAFRTRLAADYPSAENYLFPDLRIRGCGWQRQRWRLQEPEFDALFDKAYATKPRRSCQQSCTSSPRSFCSRLDRPSRIPVSFASQNVKSGFQNELAEPADPKMTRSDRSSLIGMNSAGPRWLPFSLFRPSFSGALSLLTAIWTSQGQVGAWGKLSSIVTMHEHRRPYGRNRCRAACEWSWNKKGFQWASIFCDAFCR